MTSRRLLLHLALGLAGFGLSDISVRAEDTTATRPAEVNPLPAQIDLRPRLEQRGLIPRSQGERPTCSVFTFANALEVAVANAGQAEGRLSVEFLNWSANQTGRGVRDGGFFSEMWEGFAAHGICSENAMPYQKKFDPARSPDASVQAGAKRTLELGLKPHWIKKWNVKTGLSDDEFTNIRKTLHAGWPVCGGFRWPKRDVWKDDVLQMCPPEEVFDGHSVLVVGYRDDASQPGGGLFIFRNTNRNGRDGSMPYAYARSFMNDAVWIESNKTIRNGGWEWRLIGLNMVIGLPVRRLRGGKPILPSGSQHPRGAALAAAHLVGFGVVDERFRGGIEAQLAAEFPSDGGGVAGDVAVARHGRVAGGFGAGFHAIEEIADVFARVGAGHFRGFAGGEQGGIAGDDFAVVAGFHPAEVAFEAHRAGAEAEPVAFVVETGQAHHEFDAVGVAGVDRAAVGLVFDRRGAVGIDRPLAEIDGVGSPFEDLETGGQSVVAAPLAFHIAFVDRGASPPGRASGPNRFPRGPVRVRREGVRGRRRGR